MSVSGLAPFDADGLDWLAGMYPGGVAGLRAAVAEREAKKLYESTATFSPADRAGETASQGRRRTHHRNSARH